MLISSGGALLHTLEYYDIKCGINFGNQVTDSRDLIFHVGKNHSNGSASVIRHLACKHLI